MRLWQKVLFVVALLTFNRVGRADESVIRTFLSRPIITSTQTLSEVQAFVEARIPKLERFEKIEDWQARADFFRRAIFEQLYRGEAVDWIHSGTNVEWLGTISGGEGYHIKKVRFEAVPGMWVPASLYEPEKISGKVPVVLHVSGHHAEGKVVPFKQTICINLAKRGMIALNVEWLGMGQLRSPGFEHTKMNQLDMCGTSGLAPFYFSMKHALDLLLAHPNADSNRVAATGLSGGGWQTIFISAIDARVKLSVPVAGYSSFRTRVRHFEDLGDPEQTPSDIASIVDYTHLTAMLAPRPASLIFNAKDNCCFASGHALPPLLEAAAPLYKLHGAEKNLRSHVNEIPGDHNYEKENREVFYKMLGEFFYPHDDSFIATEIPCLSEIKTSEQLDVPLPADNLDFHKIALRRAEQLPAGTNVPTASSALTKWQQMNRTKVSLKIKFTNLKVAPEQTGQDEKDGVKARFWKLKLGDTWTLPVTELSRGETTNAVIVLADKGRANASTEIEKLLSRGNRVYAVDPFYFGESKMPSHDYLFALLVAAVGDRPLGQQVSQVIAVSRWAQATKNGPVRIISIGPRMSLIALIASALEPRAIAGLDLHDSLGSLKEIIESDWSVSQAPEMFCFGLLEVADIRQLTALSAPRPVTFYHASERLQKELNGLEPIFDGRGGKIQLKP
jgi:hypothetical protein